MEQKEFLSKEKTLVLYGVASLLMVFHHLFAFPERISGEYFYVFNFENLHIETMVSYFGRICVSIYAFISGYGLTKKSKEVILVKQNYKMIFAQILKFYSHFLLVFICVLPYGFIKKIYCFKIEEFIKNLLGMTFTYNAEWWYVRQYVEMLLVFPIILFVIGILKNKVSSLLYYCSLIIALVVVMGYTYTFYNENIGVMNCFLSFFVGMIIAKEKIYMKNLKNFRQYIQAVMILILVFVIRILVAPSGMLDYILVPLLIYSCNIVIAGKYTTAILSVVGRYSTYIWLTHTFFIYYYFQKIVLIPKYSVLIFIWCLVLCLCLAVILDVIYKFLYGRIKKA